MEQFEKILKQQEREHAAKLKKSHGLICKQLDYVDCSPLYIAKPDWTNRFDNNRDATLGIFCAIWVGKSDIKKKKFPYNIHAKTLRKLPGYTLEPREFADEFRRLVYSEVADWPGIKLDYGPSTLLGGKDNCELDSFAEKVEERILGFASIHHHIDDLLEAARQT